MKIKMCLDCKKEFEVKPFAKYERKYCLKCSKKRKEDWEKIHEVKFEDCEDED